ncbi:MAG: ABC transporter ATP-binding protein [Endomicrobiales bacterium]|nr:ABC transporter ATP-binding protein [Endomicrobiales bacterium]
MGNIKVENVHKTYKLGETNVHALRGIDLKVDKSEFIGIIGPSGSGKTTLLNIIGCIDVPTSGNITIDGESTVNLDDRHLTYLRRNHIGFIFQSFNLIPVLDAFENVELPLIPLGYDGEQRRELVNDILEKVGILEFAKHKPDELSGGQRQRVAIARALVIKPSIVLADEPTANLDSDTGNKIIELMKHMNESLHTTFIISTHDPRLLDYIDKKVFLEDGRISRTESG